MTMNQKNFFAPRVHNLDQEDTDGSAQVITAVPSQQLVDGSASRRHCAILTCKCMENAPVDIAKHIGISEREAHVVYTHGGHATQDAILALLKSSKSLGTREWYVVHHTDCDAAFLSDESAANRSDEKRGADLHIDKGRASKPKCHKQLLAKHARRIRHHPFVPRDIPVHGCLYDGKSGNFLRVSTNLRQPLHLTVE
jgi:carbonic anhydrase